MVQDSVTIALTAGNETTTGRIIGIDKSLELALVQADKPLSGFVFTFADSQPHVGDSVAAMGFPRGLPLTFTEGIVSGLDRMVQVPDAKLHGLIQTDTALNPGNSGGPLIDAGGKVVGLIEAKLRQAEGISYAISATEAASTLESWKQGKALAPAACTTPVGPSGEGDVSGPSGSVSSAVRATLGTYLNAINGADYFTAWLQFTPAEQQRISVAHLASADATTFVCDAYLRNLTTVNTTTVIAYVTFTSIQAPGYGPSGETCDYWTLDYTMKRIGDQWLIDAAGPHSGSTHQQC